MILLATLYLAYLLTDAYGDVAIEQGRQAAWHRWGAAQAGLFMAVLAFAVYGISWYALCLFVALVVLRFPVFNIMHNLIKGDKWYYLSDHGIDLMVKKAISFLFYGIFTVKGITIWRGAVTMFAELLLLWMYIMLIDNSISFIPITMLVIIILSFFLVKPQNKRI